MSFKIIDVLQKRLYRILLLITLLLLVMSMLDSCEKEVQNKNLLSNISSLDISNQRFKTEIKENGDKINSQNQIILSQEQAINNGLIEIEGLKRVKSKVSVVTSTEIDTVFIPYNRVVIDTSSSKPTQYRNYFDYQEPKGWYSIGGYSSELGITIDSLRIKNDFSIYIADKKVNLFGKSNPEVLLLNKNPYTETIQMQNVIITMYKPFYKKNSFWVGVGLVGGFLLAK